MPQATLPVHTPQQPRWLPDFCSLPVLFAVIIVAELLVLAILIAPSETTQPLLPRLASASAFVQWLAMMSALCLCKLRPQLQRLAPWVGVVVAYVLMLVVTMLGSAVAFQLDHVLGLNLTLPLPLQQRFIWRNAVLCALIGAALLRYFYVIEQWRARVHAEEKARFEALQARIRPHFLFNSMNTIASLIRARPREAEQAVENLADLFRAALGNDTALSALGDELELIRRYLDIEKLRLGDRLRVEIHMDKVPATLPMPALLLQPLVENAVYHGIQALPDGGKLAIHGEATKDGYAIRIRNPRPSPGARRAERHGMALANTRARIEYHFGARGGLHVDAGADYFECTVRLPDESADR